MPVVLVILYLPVDIEKWYRYYYDVYMSVVLVILYLPVGIENYYRYYNVYQVENECEGIWCSATSCCSEL